MAKKTKPEKKEETTLSSDDQLVKELLDTKNSYLEASRGRRRIWNDCFKNYTSWVDDQKNPFLANLFIPKSHEAVELLASFLIGPNQSIQVEAEGPDDTLKEDSVRKLLDFQWRKTIKARDRLIVWIKQAEMFGNGVMKVIWSPEKQTPELIPINLPDIYYSYYHRNIQESPVIFHRVNKLTQEIKDNKYYDYNKGENRLLVVSNADLKQETEENKFGTYDDTILTAQTPGETEIFECWKTYEKEVITIAPTSQGYKIIKRKPFPYKNSDGEKFAPFVKVRFKTNPLPNRGYDIGALEPTLKIQLAFNDLVNETFDNITLINNPITIERRGANINPTNLVRKAGNRVKVEDIDRDIKWDRPPDIHQGVIEMLRFLDNEFQQASMVVNLLKGIGGADTATETTINQSNLQTMLEMIDQNIKEALSELGQMVLDIDLQHIDEIPAFKVLEDGGEETWIRTNVDEISGKYDIRIEADRSNAVSKTIRAKQLLDFMNILKGDQNTMMRYPNAISKLSKKYLKEQGWGDADSFFDEKDNQMGGMFNPTIAPGIRTPSTGQGLNGTSPMINQPKPF